MWFPRSSIRTGVVEVRSAGGKKKSVDSLIMQSMTRNTALRNALVSTVAGYRSVLVGYSGGVDSALVAVVAREVLGEGRSLAAIGVSPSLSRVQYDQAVRLARQFHFGLVEVRTDELEDPEYVANDRSRCFHCKRELWSKLAPLGRKLGLDVVADGTNADDLEDDRPGLAAARDCGIRSPLAEAGLGKEDVRAEARARGIPIWNAPAAPCLSSRVLYGLSVTPRRLGQVEEGEAFLRALGVKGDLRVRHRGEEARIEVEPSQFPLIRKVRDAVAGHFKDLGFSRVNLDLRGYRSGSLWMGGEEVLEPLAAGE